ncbi:MAG TPA: c-type cytochrome biogenesis protein CcmI [Chloroflexota bacterium]|nr:c-type cytochrome biogenesis protein CcmI [Chloroflexota bacterium]
MEYLLGALVVLAVLAFVVVPLVRRQQTESLPPIALDCPDERAAIYRELLELELDQKVGKISEADFQELSDGLLARAAALISQEDSLLNSDDAIEREIAAARASLREASPEPAPSTPAPSAPVTPTSSALSTETRP